MGRREKCWKCDRKRSDVCLRMCDDRLCEDCNDTNRAASGGRARDDDDAEINSATPGTSTTTDVNVRNDAERPPAYRCERTSELRGIQAESDGTRYDCAIMFFVL